MAIISVQIDRYSFQVCGQKDDQIELIPSNDGGYKHPYCIYKNECGAFVVGANAPEHSTYYRIDMGDDGLNIITIRPHGAYIGDFVSIDEILPTLFGHIRNIAQAHLGERITSAVVVVPNCFGGAEIMDIISAMRNIGVDCRTITATNAIARYNIENERYDSTFSVVNYDDVHTDIGLYDFDQHTLSPLMQETTTKISVHRAVEELFYMVRQLSEERLADEEINEIVGWLLNKTEVDFPLALPFETRNSDYQVISWEYLGERIGSLLVISPFGYAEVIDGVDSQLILPDSKIVIAGDALRDNPLLRAIIRNMYSDIGCNVVYGSYEMKGGLLYAQDLFEGDNDIILEAVMPSPTFLAGDLTSRKMVQYRNHPIPCQTKHTIEIDKPLGREEPIFVTNSMSSAALWCSIPAGTEGQLELTIDEHIDGTLSGTVSGESLLLALTYSEADEAYIDYQFRDLLEDDSEEDFEMEFNEHGADTYEDDFREDITYRDAFSVNGGNPVVLRELLHRFLTAGVQTDKEIDAWLDTEL